MNALPLRFGVLFQLFSGWVARRQLSVIEYLLEVRVHPELATH